MQARLQDSFSMFLKQEKKNLTDPHKGSQIECQFSLNNIRGNNSANKAKSANKEQGIWGPFCSPQQWLMESNFKNMSQKLWKA